LAGWGLWPENGDGGIPNRGGGGGTGPVEAGSAEEQTGGPGFVGWGGGGGLGGGAFRGT